MPPLALIVRHLGQISSLCHTEIVLMGASEVVGGMMAGGDVPSFEHIKCRRPCSLVTCNKARKTHLVEIYVRMCSLLKLCVFYKCTSLAFIILCLENVSCIFEISLFDT